MKTCATCDNWLKLGHSPTRRHVMYDSRAFVIEPGDEGQCRALPPPMDNRWPLTMGADGCGKCWTPILTEDAAPRASAAGETPEPATDGVHNHTTPAGGKSVPPVKPAAPSGAGGPPSLLQRLTGRGQGRSDAQR